MTFFRLALRNGFLVLFLGGSVVLASCDGGGTKQASQARQLSGEWQDADDVIVDNSAYSRDVLFDIEEGTGQKSYRLTRVSRGDTSTVEGRLEVVASNTLRMTGEFTPSPLIWTFDFDEPDPLAGSVRLTLRSARDESVEAFLGVLGISRGADRVEMDLERPS